MVKGPSIRAAETLAKYWGNIDFGIKELSQNLNTHTSEVMAYAWDLETNTRQTKTFTVNHIRVSNDKKTKEQTNLAALLRVLYHGILQVTKDKTNRRLWQKDKRDGIYQALNFNDFELVNTFVKEIGWRF